MMAERLPLPAGNAWTPVLGASEPLGRWGHTAVWTGSEMLVWGGYSYNSVGYFSDTVLYPYAPALRISRLGPTGADVAWPVWYPSLRVYQAASLSGGQWTIVTESGKPSRIGAPRHCFDADGGHSSACSIRECQGHDQLPRCVAGRESVCPTLNRDEQYHQPLDFSLPLVAPRLAPTSCRTGCKTGCKTGRPSSRCIYNHRLGQETAVQETPPSTLQKLVRLDLKKEAVLLKAYRVTLTPAIIEAEVQRINHTSRAPEMLAEIKDALGNRPGQIRPSLRQAVPGRAPPAE